MQKSKKTLKKGKDKVLRGKLSTKSVKTISIKEPILTKEKAKKDMAYWTKKLDFYEKKGMIDQIKMCKDMLDHYLDKLSVILINESKFSKSLT